MTNDDDCASDFRLITDFDLQAPNHPAWQAFLKTMKGRVYEQGPLNDAWRFFRDGWVARWAVLPERKVFDASAWADREAEESGDYIDGWNEALDAIAKQSSDIAQGIPGDLTPEQLEGMVMWDRDVILAEQHRAVGAMLVKAAVAEIRRRRAESAGGCSVHGGAIHGGEAEELRDGIEKLLAEYDGHPVPDYELNNLLDSVDARDSLAVVDQEAHRLAESGARIRSAVVAAIMADVEMMCDTALQAKAQRRADRIADRVVAAWASPDALDHEQRRAAGIANALEDANAIFAKAESAVRGMAEAFADLLASAPGTDRPTPDANSIIGSRRAFDALMKTGIEVRGGLDPALALFRAGWDAAKASPAAPGTERKADRTSPADAGTARSFEPVIATPEDRQALLYAIQVLSLNPMAGCEDAVSTRHTKLTRLACEIVARVIDADVVASGKVVAP